MPDIQFKLAQRRGVRPVIRNAGQGCRHQGAGIIGNGAAGDILQLGLRLLIRGLRLVEICDICTRQEAVDPGAGNEQAVRCGHCGIGIIPCPSTLEQTLQLLDVATVFNCGFLHAGDQIGPCLIQVDENLRLCKMTVLECNHRHAVLAAQGIQIHGQGTNMLHRCDDRVSALFCRRLEIRSD